MDFAALLKVGVDSADLKKAERELDRLATSGARAEQVVGKAMDGVEDGFKKAESGAKGAAKATDTMALSLRSVAGIAGGIAGTIAGAFSIGAIAQAADRYAGMANGLKAMGLSAGQAASQLEEITAIALRTRAPLDATVQLYSRISVAAGELGASQADVLQFTENVGLALGAAGIGANEAAGALGQLSQAMAGGTVRAEEFSSILEGAYPLALAAARGIDEAGGSVGRLRQLVVEGKVSSEEFFNAILSQGNALAETFGKTDMTIGQAMGNLGTAMTATIGQMDQAIGASAAVAGAINMVAQNMGGLVSIAGDLSGVLLVLVSTRLPGLAMAAYSVVAQMGAAATAAGIMTGAVTALNGALALVGGPVGLIVAGVAALGVSFYNGTQRANEYASAVDLAAAAQRSLNTVLDEFYANRTVEAWQRARDAASAAVEAAQKELAAAQARADAMSMATNLFGYSIGGGGWISDINAQLAETEGKLMAALAALDAMDVAGNEFAGSVATGNTALAEQLRLMGETKAESASIRDTLDSMIGDYQRQADLQREIARYGEGSYRVEVLRYQQARDAVLLKAQELGLTQTQTNELIRAFNATNQVMAAASGLESFLNAAAGAASNLAAQLANAARQLPGVGGAIGSLIDKTTSLASGIAGKLKSAITGAASGLKTFATGMVNVAASAGKGGGGGGAASAIDEAAEAAKRLREEMQRPLISAIDGVANAFGDFIAGGLKNFKGFVQSILGSFKNMISQMIAMAVRNKIMIGLDISPMGMAGAAGAATGLTGGGGGLLGGILGGGGGGGLMTGLNGILSGGGLGASFANLGGLLSGTTSGLGAIGAALPALGVVLGGVGILFGLFSKKVKQLDNGVRVTMNGLDALVESFKTIQTSRFFGLSKKITTSYEQVDAEVSGPIQQAIDGIGQATKDMATSIGASFDMLRDFAYQFQVSTAGMSTDDAQKAILGAMEGLSDALAKEILMAAEGFERIRGTRTVTENVYYTPDRGQPKIIGTTTTTEAYDNIDEFASKFAKEGEGFAQTLQRLSVSLQTVNGTFLSLGMSLYTVSIQGANMASKLVDAFGGLDQMGAATQSYFENYYTAQEQLGLRTEALARAFEDANVRMPRSTAQLRRMVEAQDLTTQRGRDVYATLLTLSGEFAELDRIGRELNQTQSGMSDAARGELQNLRAQMQTLRAQSQGQDAVRALELSRLQSDAARNVQQNIWALTDRMNRLAEQARAAEAAMREREGLEGRILQLTGNTAAIRRRELAALDPANRELQKRIWALEAEAERQQRLQAIADERSGLERQLLELQGKTGAIRRLELEALAPANRALQQRIWAMQDAAEKEARIAQQAEERAQRQAAIADERAGLDRRILELQGKTGAIRQLELQALNPANRALQQRIWALEAEAERQQQLQAIAQERSGLERQLLELQGKTGAIRQLELAALDPSNRALQQRIWALQDAAEREGQIARQAEERAQRQAAIADERSGLERRILELTGDTAAIRRLELQALNPANRALQRRIWSLEDEAERQQRLQAIADERRGIENELLRMMGDTAEIRRRELAELAPANRALQNLVYRMTDARSAVDAATAAFERSADAERQRIDKLRSMSEAIRNTAMQAAEATFGVSEAQRRNAVQQLRLAIRTGQVWDESLQGLAETAMKVDAGNFRTAVDFLRASGRTAGVLASLADIQGQKAMTAEERLEAALAKYGLQDETVRSLSETMRSLDRTLAQLTMLEGSAVRAVPAFASGGMHSGGLALVGEQGPELVNMGPGRVFTADQTRNMMRQPDNEALRRELEEVKGYMRELVKINIKQERSLKEIEMQGETV